MRADIHGGQEHKRSIQGPDTEAQDLSPPNHHFPRATRGRSIQKCQNRTHALQQTAVPEGCNDLFDHLVGNRKLRDRARRDVEITADLLRACYFLLSTGALSTGANVPSVLRCSRVAATSARAVQRSE
jgi:hypothetical protein